MIERLSGTLSYRDGNHVVIDVVGVGYGVDTTDRAVAKLQLNQPVSLWIYTDVRDDDIKLFGFPSLEERILFTHLISAPGVGPKLALSMLSHLGGHGIVGCVLADEAERLKQVPGIAAKAKEIQLHLKRRLSKLEDDAWLVRLMSDSETPGADSFSFEQKRLGSPASSTLTLEMRNDLQSALLNLGYKDKEIQVTLKALLADSGDVSFGALLRRSIALLTRSDLRSTGVNSEKGSLSLEVDKVF